jgi:electron transfer flavoprotein beta subunit
MKILVCIKQVPDMESRFRINGEGIWYDEADLAWRMNEYDEYAVEQAVQLKEQLGGAPEITVLSIGPERVKEAMKKALAMGCDCGVHIRDDNAWSRDSFQIASLVAAYARPRGYDVVFTGMQSQDRGSAQVGGLLAEILGIASVTTIVGFEFADGVVTARRELEGGARAVVRTGLPALFTCQLGLNTPRYPTLPNIMKAKKKPIGALAGSELGQIEPLVSTQKLSMPVKRSGGLVLEGDIGDLAERLMGILKEKTAVLR